MCFKILRKDGEKIRQRNFQINSTQFSQKSLIFSIAKKPLKSIFYFQKKENQSRESIGHSVWGKKRVMQKTMISILPEYMTVNFRNPPLHCLFDKSTLFLYLFFAFPPHYSNTRSLIAQKSTHEKTVATLEKRLRRGARERRVWKGERDRERYEERERLKCRQWEQ